jgi:hypothetical protein
MRVTVYVLLFVHNLGRGVLQADILTAEGYYVFGMLMQPWTASSWTQNLQTYSPTCSQRSHSSSSTSSKPSR